jgi:putative Ca2+/H+ antiporter (TMEM165/GDT1 family)
MSAIPLVAALVFVAEIGDKSQLVALSFATRYPRRVVLAGLFLAAALMHGLAVTVGAAVAAIVPARAVGVAAGLLFLVFGLMALRSEEDDEEDVEVGTRRGRSGVGTVAGAFLAAEFGDKTMLASTTLAATHGALATWIGATMGMFGASALAVAVGGQLAARLRPRSIRLAAALLFLAVGVVVLVGAIRG